jgi:cytochrome b subunit of formate dehydrogenase
MPRKLRIILWVAIGLTIGALLWITLQSLYPSGVVPNVNITVFIISFALVFVCGVLIVRWTRGDITQNPLKRYLLLAGASAMGILFFGTVVHMFTEFGFVMATIVCPAALIVGAVLALRFKVNP